MKIKFLLLIIIIFISTGIIHSQENSSDQFKIKWDNGFKVESSDKKFKFKFGGRIMLDHAYFFQDEGLDDAFGELESNDGTEFRRARLFFSGVLYKNMEFKLQVDFAGGKARLKDAYLGYKNIPVIGRIRVGHIKEPLRFDALTSSKYITFLERAIPADLANERNNGILLMNDFFHNKLSVQAGVFRNADEYGNDKYADKDVAVTSRVTTLLIDNKEKKQLLHLGFTYSFRKPDKEIYKISVRPKSHLTKKYISTGLIPDVKTVNIINFELAYSKGPFTAQGEYLGSSIKRDSPDFSENYNFNNYYGQLSYFLTGEHRSYKGSYATFGRLKPKIYLMNGKKGFGAVELALRYTHTSLNSKDIYGGDQSDISFGTNWYLNSAARVMFNYVWTDISKKDAGSGTLNIFQIRFQIDF